MDDTKIRCIHKIKKHSNKYVMFYSKWCTYSQKALKTIKESGKEYRFYDIDEIPGGLDTVLEILNKNKNEVGFNSKHTTRPIIFFNGKFIGGYTDLVKFIEQE